MYYGFPEENQDRINALNGDVLYIHGTQGASIAKEASQLFEQKVKKTGNDIRVESYNTVRAFANPFNPKFDKANAADAAAKSKVFLSKALKQYLLCLSILHAFSMKDT